MDPAFEKIDDALLDEVVETLGPTASYSQSRALISRILNCYGAREDPRREFAYELAHALYYRRTSNRHLFVQPTDREAGIIGQGSFAEVHRAKLQGEDVALKVMKESFTQFVSSGSLKLFIRELEAWKEIPPHVNLLPLLGICIDVDRLHCCVRYVLVSPFAGENLLQLSVSSMPLHNVRDIFLQVARGLEFLHKRVRPIIHGDIRASNILIKDDRVVLADFGLAKVLEAHSSSFTLSPLRSKMRHHWLAPELINDETRSRTTATDIFAFACTVIEAFTKQPPSVYPPQLDPRPPRALEGQHWKPLWDLVKDCLHEDPSQRPTASQLVMRIEPLFPHTDDLARKFLEAHSGND